MKKLFAILMAVLMVLSISACSNGSGGSEKPAEEEYITLNLSAGDNGTLTVTNEAGRVQYMNGANQFGKKSSVEADAYVKIQKSYASVIKQLTDLLPDSIETAAGTEILDFLNKND